MKYIILFILILSTLAVDAQKRKRVKEKIKEEVREWIHDKTAPDTMPSAIPYEPPPKLPRAGKTPYNLDTVMVASLTLKMRDWCYIVANVDLNNRDSVTYKRLRSMRDQARAANPPTWTSDLIITNLPGEWLVRIYNYLVKMDAGELAQLDTRTIQNIRAVTKLKFWYDQIDAQFPIVYTNDRNTGKHILLDQ